MTRHLAMTAAILIAASAPALAFAAAPMPGEGANGSVIEPSAGAVAPGGATTATPAVSPPASASAAGLDNSALLTAPAMSGSNAHGTHLALGDTVYGASGEMLGSISRLNMAPDGSIDRMLIRVQNGGGDLRILSANGIAMRDGRLIANMGDRDLSTLPQG